MKDNIEYNRVLSEFPSSELGVYGSFSKEYDGSVNPIYLLDKQVHVVWGCIWYSISGRPKYSFRPTRVAQDDRVPDYLYTFVV